MAKRKTKKKIIAGIASSVVLVSGATAGILCTSEMEVENKEEKAKKRKVSIKVINQPIARNHINGQQDLATLLPDSQRNLGNIVINQGNDFVVKQIEDILVKKNIDISQIEVIKIRLKTAIIKPLVDSAIYGGNPIVVHFNSDDRQPLSWVVPDWQRNLGTLIIDGWCS